MLNQKTDLSNKKMISSNSWLLCVAIASFSHKDRDKAIIDCMDNMAIYDTLQNDKLLHIEVALRAHREPSRLIDSIWSHV